MEQRKIGICISYFNIVLHAVVGFGYVPLLLRYIGKDEYGLYQLIGSFIAYFTVMDFGLASAVIRFYARYKALQDKVGMENVLALAVRAYMVISVVLVILGSVVYVNLENLFGSSMTIAEIATAKQLFLLLLLNIILTISTMVFRSVINAHEKFLVLKGLETIQIIIQPIVIALVIKKYPSALTVAAVQTILNICLIATRVYYCFYKLHIKIKFHYWDKVLFNNFRKLAFSVFAVTLINQLFFKTNQIILGMVYGTASVAVYSVSSLIYMNYMALSTAISGVYLPHITGIIAMNESVNKLSKLFIQVGRWQFYLLGLVATGFIIFGKQFIYIWAGNGFEDAYWITLLIIIPFTIDLIQNIGLSIMQAQNKYDFRAKVYLVMGIFNLCLAAFLVEKYSGMGCAFATGLSMFLGNGLVMNWYYIKIIGLDIKRFWQEIMKIAAVVFIVSGVGYLFDFLFCSSNIFLFISKILGYTVFYSFILYKYSLNSDERNKVQTICFMIKKLA